MILEYIAKEGSVRFGRLLLIKPFFSLLCFSGTHCTSMAKELESQKEVEKCELIASYKPLLHFPKDLSEYEYVESIQL